MIKKRAVAKRRSKASSEKIIAIEYWGSSKLQKRNKAYLLPVPQVLARKLDIKAGDVLGMMVVLSDVAPAAKGSLILQRLPRTRMKRPAGKSRSKRV